MSLTVKPNVTVSMCPQMVTDKFDASGCHLAAIITKTFGTQEGNHNHVTTEVASFFK